MSFSDLTPLWLGGPLVALILVGVWSHGTRRRRLAAFLGGRRALVRLARTDLSGLRLGRAFLLGLAGACLALAAADPHWVAPPPPEDPPLDRVVIGLDVSASMQATDVVPTRLARAADMANGLLAELGGQQVGLMLFAGTTYPIAPPTLDHSAVAFLLRGVVPTMASAYDPGTLLSVAVTNGVGMLEAVDSTRAPARVGRKRLVLIGDGDTGDTEGALAEAIATATAAGVEVYTIGVGTERGGQMSLPAGTYQLGGPVTNAAGQRAVSRMREPVLRDLAAAGGGRYAHADVEGDVAALSNALLAPPPVAEDAETAPPAWARFDLPFTLGIAALILVLMESLLDASLPRLFTRRQPEGA